MKYKLGDFVRFVDEKMEGFVTRIIDEQMIGVTGEDDFEIPVLASKVTTVHGYQSIGEMGKTHSEAPQISNAEFKTKGVHIGFVNDAKVNSVLHFYLINETSYQLLASFTTEKDQQYKGEFDRFSKLAPSFALVIYIEDYKCHSGKICDFKTAYAACVGR